MLFPAYAQAYAQAYVPGCLHPDLCAAVPRLVCDFSRRAPLAFADNGLPLAPIDCDLGALYTNGVIHAIVIYTVIVGAILWREKD